MEQIETLVNDWALLVKLVFEIASIIAISVGGVVALWTLITQFSNPDWMRITRTKLAKYLLLALEIQLAADIVGTAIAPSWEQLVTLAGIAVIRTFLNYFLMIELREETAATAEDAA